VGTEPLNVSRSHPIRPLAANDAPPIGERAAARECVAMDVGDGQADVKRPAAIAPANVPQSHPAANDATRDAPGRKVTLPHRRLPELDQTPNAGTIVKVVSVAPKADCKIHRVPGAQGDRLLKRKRLIETANLSLEERNRGVDEHMHIGGRRTARVEPNKRALKCIHTLGRCSPADHAVLVV
jgi:hypothetical protein